MGTNIMHEVIKDKRIGSIDRRQRAFEKGPFAITIIGRIGVSVLEVSNDTEPASKYDIRDKIGVQQRQPIIRTQ